MIESKEEILRPLHVDDVSAAFQLSAQAGWNQTEEDWHTLLDLAPETCFGIEIRGELASTTTLICYGRCLGWIGMVLTKSEFQRRGLARKLLHHTLNLADKIGIQTLKLDATDQGQPLYTQCGFRGEHEIERWSGSGLQGGPFIPVRPSSRAWQEEDPKYFAADRLPLLERLARRSSPLLQGRAYLFARPGRVRAYLGPCVSDNPGDARTLISACTENAGGKWVWDLFPSNQEAVGIASDLGFTPQRHLLRMARGKELTQNIDATYAIAGFELG
jgi:GNAT superfamily N-acetyltransferase